MCAHVVHAVRCDALKRLELSKKCHKSSVSSPTKGTVCAYRLQIEEFAPNVSNHVDQVGVSGPSPPRTKNGAMTTGVTFGSFTF